MPRCVEVAYDVKRILMDVPFGDDGGIHYVEYIDLRGDRQTTVCSMWPAWATPREYERRMQYAARPNPARGYYALQAQLDALTGFRLSGFHTSYEDYIRRHPIFIPGSLSDQPRPLRRFWNCLKAIGAAFIHPKVWGP